MPHAATLNSPKPHSATPAPGAAAPSLFAFAMLSDAGRVRHINQDACAALPEHGAFIVCDGVGGAAGGEVASHLAVDAFLNALIGSQAASTGRRTKPIPANSDPGPGPGPEDPHHPHARLCEAVLTANRAVFDRAQKSRALRGMATTLVAALLDPVAALLDPAAALLDPTAASLELAPPDPTADPSDRPAASQNGAAAEQAVPDCPTLWLAHVGDSRGYRLRRHGDGAAFTLLTRDHSLVEEQVRAGLLSRIQAAASPMRNVITRAVGSVAAVEPEIAAHPILPGDLYLLASDGLTRELDDDVIARILVDSLASLAAFPATPDAAAHALGNLSRPSATTLGTAARALIDAANAHGGRDNITVLLIACR